MVKKKIRKDGKQDRREGARNPNAKKAIVEAMIGNHFWQMRSKHGTDILFATPKLLLEAAMEYFKSCDENPILVAENKIVSNGGNSGSSVELHEKPIRRVYSIHGVCRYMGTHPAYFRQFKESKAYKANKDFSTVISFIESMIFEQQFEGATSGQFNANIISRALGLIDKTDITSAGEKIEPTPIKIFNTAPPMAGSEEEIKVKKEK